ncbi:MAG: CBS domain-containing protein [Chitinophagales bacterium]|nr:CBS domain-containing protein [Chitinophagales bacterium]
MHEADVSFERTDLDYYLSQVSFDELVEQERLDNEVKILQNVLEFPLTRARKCMVPRTEIVAIEINAPIEELIKLFIETGHSKIMVYRDSIDEIVGFVHSFEIFKNPSTIREAMLSAVIVPETMLVKDILALLTQQHKSVAVVVDEYGGTSGMLTTEDIIEEIFGEIEDEHDSQDLVEKVNEDGTFLFSGRLKIDYINDTYSLNLPQRLEYTTLAGLILDLEKSIPKIGQTIEIEGFRFIIQRVSDTKIEEVIINPIKSDMTNDLAQQKRNYCIFVPLKKVKL